MQTSTKGKGLGITCLIIGIVTLVWSEIPRFGAFAFFSSIIGMGIGTIAVIVAIRGMNPKKWVAVTGFVLCMLSTSIATSGITFVPNEEQTGSSNGLNQTLSTKI